MAGRRAESPVSRRAGLAAVPRLGALSLSRATRGTRGMPATLGRTMSRHSQEARRRGAGRRSRSRAPEGQRPKKCQKTSGSRTSRTATPCNSRKGSDAGEVSNSAGRVASHAATRSWSALGRTRDTSDGNSSHSIPPAAAAGRWANEKTSVEGAWRMKITLNRNSRQLRATNRMGNARTASRPPASSAGVDARRLSASVLRRARPSRLAAFR